MIKCESQSRYLELTSSCPDPVGPYLDPRFFDPRTLYPGVLPTTGDLYPSPFPANFHTSLLTSPIPISSSPPLYPSPPAHSSYQNTSRTPSPPSHPSYLNTRPTHSPVERKQSIKREGSQTPPLLVSPTVSFIPTLIFCGFNIRHDFADIFEDIFREVPANYLSFSLFYSINALEIKCLD